MATSYRSPGVYIEEVPSQIKSIAGVGTNTVGFIGIVEDEVQVPRFLDDDVYQAQVTEAFDKLYGSDADYSDAKIKNKLEEAGKAREAAEKAVGEADKAAKARAEDAAKAAKRRVITGADGSTDEEDVASSLATARQKEATAQGELAQAKERAEREVAAADALEQLSKKPEAERVRGARALKREQARAMVLRYEPQPFTVDVPAGQAKLCTNFSEYQARFGGWSAYDAAQVPLDSQHVVLNGHQILSHAVFGFFNNGGGRAFVVRVRRDSLKLDLEQALKALESVESVALVAFPGLSADKDIAAALVAHCELTKYRFAILDAPQHPLDGQGRLDLELLTYNNAQSQLPSRSKHAGLYFPYIEAVDPALQLQQSGIDSVPDKYKGLVHVPPSGAIAGVYARTDVQRGVFKAPANASVLGARNVQYYIGRAAQEGLNPQGVNCIRTLNGDITVWGARTLGGDENNEWRYVSVRRTFLFLAKSIDAGTQWVVFEPNTPALWGAVRRNVIGFLTTVWRDGALFGTTPEEAFYVKCDAENNPLDSREIGRLVIEVGVAIVRPAEFVIFRITQGTARNA
ncbi:phage tail sheath C-terminal domain-containing protein [Pseudorhodoferax sp.]|uniref:phage tail sheath C-terminal domain-containing protein n=1 Tax=Pseudorhodoferax sp. TaxID=1993553 RepID=UPI002DD68E4A|nr:phage tail sheath C-terminal domain-containing protein [Pseudorhodoferax sp.]